jgi:hypothetical protein
MYLRTLALAAVALGTVALASGQVIVPAPIDAFQVSYASNLLIGDSVVNITNTGEYTVGTGSAFGPGNTSGNICVNAYVFDPAEEEIACCSCLVTANALNSLSVRNDLISNTLTAGSPTAVVIKLVANNAGATSCNPSSPAPGNLVAGMRAWSTTIHALPATPPAYGITETPFLPSELGVGELTKLVNFCGFIQNDASGAGICKSCRVGGLGASTK